MSGEHPFGLVWQGVPNECKRYPATFGIGEGNNSVSIRQSTPGRGKKAHIWWPFHCAKLGILLGVLLISEMPFLSLHREALQILGVLLAYTADHSEAAIVADKIIIIYPDCPPNVCSGIN